MYDDERDPWVAGLLTSTAEAATPYIRPHGADAVHRTVRRRRNRRISIAAAAVVALAAPLAVFALAGRPGADHPAGNPPPSGASVAPSDGAPPAPASGAPTAAAPNGRISAADVRSATLQVPDWPNQYGNFDTSAPPGCPSGSVKFSGGKGGKNGAITLKGDPVYADVDHDGAQETVILLECHPQGADYQVLALDRDAADKIVTLGRVVRSGGRETVDIMTIWAVQAGDNGQVKVDVGEYRPCCEQIQASQHQWRTYGWDGRQFIQTAGPTTWGPNPKVTALVLTGDPVTMVKQADGSRVGTLRLTIRNAAKYTTPGRLWLDPGIPKTWTVTSFSGCQLVADYEPVNCSSAALPAGASRVVTVEVAAPAGGSPISADLRPLVGARDGDAGLWYPDVASGGATNSGLHIAATGA
ncbi:hypothetical protein Dvina_24200 [Dactylosporangium vinaceum]|uniref:Uncharacterized protein n=1 Tax=Dactylosporangium vinaceum TaxID=53362 RepID=A0ABV5MD99_9ACTN|nr:hypothetical protein [Dactylosporangium vinaceum]UAC00881.1 hypothetical protein Dvina_24200 [Dactylosporangium vinaceum]